VFRIFAIGLYPDVFESNMLIYIIKNSDIMLHKNSHSKGSVENKVFDLESQGA
jgi:hypothetical protein